MISSTSLFNAKPTTAHGQQWKTIAPTAAESSGVFQAKKADATGAAGNGTNKLADKLTGVASDVFKFLSEKTQKTLDNLVSKGALKVEEVSLGLRSIASQAAFGRFSAERQKTDEEVDNLQRMETVQKALFGQDVADTSSERFQQAALMEAYGKNEISEENLNEKMKPLTDSMRQKLDSYKKLQQDVLGTDLGTFTGKQINGYLKNSIEQFNSMIVPGSNTDGADDGFLKFGDAKGKEAADKMLSFFSPDDKSAFTRDQLGYYAASVDLRGIGTGTYTPIVDNGPAPQTGNSAGNNTATTLLQSALNAKTGQAGGSGKFVAGAAGSNGDAAADAALTSLIDAIKNGAKPTSPSVVIDT